MESSGEQQSIRQPALSPYEQQRLLQSLRSELQRYRRGGLSTHESEATTHLSSLPSHLARLVDAGVLSERQAEAFIRLNVPMEPPKSKPTAKV